MKLFIKWEVDQSQSRRGRFAIKNGLLKIAVHEGEAIINDDEIVISRETTAILQLSLSVSDIGYGNNATIISWRAEENSFSFLASTVPGRGRISSPDLEVSIARSPDQLSEASNSSHHKTTSIGPGPHGREIGMEVWAKRNREVRVPTLLGLSRDQRFFVADFDNDTIKATRDIQTPTVVYQLGRPTAAGGQSFRRLEGDCLPILHAEHKLDHLTITDTCFSSYGDRELTLENLTGTPVELAHLYSAHSTFPVGYQQSAGAFVPDGEIVLYVRSRVTNHSDIPLLAPLLLPCALGVNKGAGKERKIEAVSTERRLDEVGVMWSGDIPFSMHQINGEVPKSRQPCPLLQPGESMTVDSLLSHSRKGLSESVRRGRLDWERKFSETQTFWSKKLIAAGSLAVPEKRLMDFWRTGLLHLDLVTLGEKGGPLLPKVGVYSAIGSESIPIVEFYDSLGRHEEARRCLDFFFEFQNPDGRINVYHNYDIETGAVLYLAGLHYRYTKDIDWIHLRLREITMAADYLISLRSTDQNSKNFGLIQGICADPEEPKAAFMLNAYNIAGLHSVAEMLQAVGGQDAVRYKAVADEYACCLRKSLIDSFAKGPLLPVAPDRWVPSCASWVDGVGPGVMGLQGGSSYTHRTYFAFDVLLGPLYAAFAGVIDFDERMVSWLLDINRRQFNRDALAESQPYYSRHPELHLLRGEREEFLNAFYSGITSLADRETFTFWEHFHEVSMHKTHEEGWALMQMRRMLWLEARSELRLLSGIPQSWLDAGNVIEITGGGSYFGDFSFRLERAADGKLFKLSWDPKLHTAPSALRLYLPGINNIPAQQEPRLSSSTDGCLEIASPRVALETMVIVG